MLLGVEMDSNKILLNNMYLILIIRFHHHYLQMGSQLRLWPLLLNNMHFIITVRVSVGVTLKETRVPRVDMILIINFTPRLLKQWLPLPWLPLVPTAKGMELLRMAILKYLHLPGESNHTHVSHIILVYSTMHYLSLHPMVQYLMEETIIHQTEVYLPHLHNRIILRLR